MIKRATASPGQVNPWSWRGHELWHADDNPAYEKSSRPTVPSDHGIINMSRSSFFLHSSTCFQEPPAAASRGPPWAGKLGLGWCQMAPGVSLGKLRAETWSCHTHHRPRSTDVLPIKKANYTFSPAQQKLLRA